MAEAAEQNGGSGRKPILIFAAVVVLAIAASIGGTLYFVGSGDTAETVESAAVPAVKNAIYHNLRPAFVVNYQTGNKPRYMQADLTIMARDPAVVDALITHMPLIRSRILAYLADLDFYDLQTHAGKEAMREGVRDLINAILREEAQIDGVQSVLFNNFVMQ